MMQRKKQRKTKVQFTKKIVSFCLINGVLWCWCSYILAYLGRVEIAESLSQTAVTEILGVVLVYCAKALFEKKESFGNVTDNYPE